MKEAEVRDTLTRLFSSQKLAVLATSDPEGKPYCSLVAFVATDDLGRLLFATTRATRKYANLRNDCRVAMLIDSRTNDEADFRDAVSTTATGSAAEIVGEERERLLPLYLAKHPHLEQFVHAPTCAVLAMDVDTYYVCCRFQNVTELHLRR